MTSFVDLQPVTWSTMLDGLRVAAHAATSLEEAAQAVARALHEGFAASTVLARVYVTMPLSEVMRDPTAKGFVEGLAKSKGLEGALLPNTPCLTLLGTHGVDPAWCDRKASKGHVSIPLASAAFVDAIPMVARLLKELGVDLAWLDEAPELQARRLLGGFNGLFFVRDARTVRDAKGRLVIPAQDFVEEHDVRSVFGMGGFYPDGTMIVALVFSREDLTKADGEITKSLISLLKGETFGVVRARRWFT